MPNTGNMKTVPDPSDPDEDTVEVILPSAGTFQVYPTEVKHFKDTTKRYLKDNKFVNIADLQDVDRMVILELLVWRYGNWVSRQKNYWDEAVDEVGMSKTIKDLSAELRSIKAALGIDKVSRDKQRGEDSFSAWLDRTKSRALEFKVMREKQLSKSIELFQELKALVVLTDNTTSDEQREMHCSRDDVWEWITQRAIPDFDQIDEHFRKNKQAYWIRDQ